ncbi:MAG TPA: TetR/AcrR family transcriptional regulator [Kofleriaceae bacterium]|nr:TetR/AcrR family transcriptional regulator [Kofleriaceae bacterium]
MGRTQRRGETARTRLLATTAELLHKQGYSSTGMNQILDESKAPKGSLYFYFPGGKEELVAAALSQASEGLSATLQQLLDASPTPVAAVKAVIAFFKGQLEHSHFTKGCPVATVALEQSATSDALHEVCAGAYRGWHRLVEKRLVRDGYSPARADSLANFFLTTLEGALLVSRAHRSTAPLVAAGNELIRILEQGDHA